jgi:DNA-binding NtrC family response regulator
MESLRDKSILVVEDDAGLLRALEKVLSNEGCVVTCASWAAEAMDHLADGRKHFDLIITDLRVPFVRGNTILRMITRWSNSASGVPQPDTEGTTAVVAVGKTSPVVPIIVITAFGTPEMKAECLAQGAAAFLEKPLNTQELLSAISLVLTPPDSGSTYPAAA